MIDSESLGLRVKQRDLKEAEEVKLRKAGGHLN